MAAGPVWRSAFLNLLVVVAAACTSISRSTIVVPAGESIDLDGVLASTEWSGALTKEMVNGGQVLLKHDDENLYIGIKGAEFGWSHVCVSAGKRVRVFHASAALGTAEYRLEENRPTLPIRMFEWAMRDATQTEAALRAREAFLTEHQWVASTAWMGVPEDREYVISLKLIEHGTPRIAIVYVSDEKEPDYYYWPASLSDDAMNEKLATGRTFEEMRFRTSQWATLDLRK